MGWRRCLIISSAHPPLSGRDSTDMLLLSMAVVLSEYSDGLASGGLHTASHEDLKVFLEEK